MNSIFVRSAVTVSLALSLSLVVGCSVEMTPEEDTVVVQQATSVVDSAKCPERIRGGGPGNFVGGVCIHPMAIGGCGWTLWIRSTSLHDGEGSALPALSVHVES
jgi:hypothetical protein